MLLIDRTNRAKYGQTLEKAYRLRHQVFVEEMGWRDLHRDDGLERDRYDTEDAVEMVCAVNDAVVGYQRLLPTTRPHLLSDIYPQLCDGPPPSSPRIWEWTRFAVAKSHRGDGKSLGPVALDLVTAFVEWGLARGVDALIVEMTPVQLLRFVTCRFRPVPLGVAHVIDGQEIIAIRAGFDNRTLARLHELRGVYTPVLEMGER